MSIAPLVKKISSPSRTKQTMGFVQPAGGIAPDACPVLGDGEIEARLVEWHMLGVGVNQREVEAELDLKSLDGLELPAREVDRDRAHMAPCEPRRDRRRSAAELDDVGAGLKLADELKLGLRSVPDAPIELLDPATSSRADDLASNAQRSQAALFRAMCSDVIARGRHDFSDPRSGDDFGRSGCLGFASSHVCTHASALCAALVFPAQHVRNLLGADAARDLPDVRRANVTGVMTRFTEPAYVVYSDHRGTDPMGIGAVLEIDGHGGGMG